MIFKEEINPSFAKKLFKDDELVLKFLAQIKWANGFTCRKCQNTNYCEGKTAYSRRCTKCKTDESATSHTLFHNCKFPLSKAFFIAYKVCIEGNPLSSYEYADKLGIRQMTCWKFRKKISECLIKKSKNLKNHNVTIDVILMTDNL